MQALAAIFQRRAGTEANPAVVTAPRDAPCRDVVEAMAKANASAAIIVADQGRAVGIVTEADVVRRIAAGGMMDRPVGDAMSSPVRTVAADDYLYNAIGRMRRLGLRHLPVVDAAGGVAGIIDLHEAYADAVPAAVDLIDRLAHETSLEGLRHVKAAQAELAGRLLGEGVDATDVQSVLADIDRDIHGRVLALILDRMAEEPAWREPPVRFALIVMGSAGRGECLLRPDQDNGFILDDYPDEDHDRIDGWFRELADRMTRELDRLGIPLCSGNVMATNPVWRKTRTQWRVQLEIWSDRRLGQSARLAEILADFTGVWGETSFAEELRAVMNETIAGNREFMQDMFQLQADHRVPLGLFQRFITEKRDKRHRGEIDLKHWGTLPLVEGARLLALRHRVTERPTLARLAGLHEQGVIEKDLLDGLMAGYRQLIGLLLRQQLIDFEADREFSNFVDPAGLTRRERADLKESFRVIGRFRDTVRTAFMGGILG